MTHTIQQAFRHPRFVIFLITLLWSVNISYGQVTIGGGESPLSGSLLQLKEKANIIDDSPNSYRGLALPRVNLSEKKELYPMFLTNPDLSPHPSSNPATAEYLSDKASLDKMHTGLIVYNLKEDEDKDLCLGLNQWNGEQWNCFQQQTGNAIATIDDCDNITFSGIYKNGVFLNGSNYMSITLNVTKAGAYNIVARAGYSVNPSQDNGYYFTSTGVFLTVGTYTLLIPGSGTPLDFTPIGNNGDIITITMNDKPLTLSNGTTTCDKNIFIEDSTKKPLYTMACGKTEVHGVYQLDKELDSNNYIRVALNVDAGAMNATYVIETDVVDGIYFKGQGLLTVTGEQVVTLQGYGIPNSYENKDFTITSNSAKTTATCKATVTIALSKKVTYGWGYYENTAGYIMQSGQGIRKIVDANINFGTDANSTVKIVKHNATQTFDHTTLSVSSAYSPTSIKAMFDSKPEIILTGFDLDIALTNRSTVAGYMVDYLKEGGVLILVLERATMMEAFFQALYPGTTISTTWLTATRYQFNYTNDEIINGPFGDIRGQFWGNDSQGAISVTGLPEEDIVVYSRDPSNKPLIFKHKNLNLFVIGEGGVFANHNGTSGPGAGGSATTYPVAFDSNSVPITRTGWSGGNVENGRLFGNVMAWAIKQAQLNGYKD